MGVMLSSPVELTRVQRKGSSSFRCAVAEMQGWRTNHEDAHEMICDDSSGVFWVLDGHGGDGASIYCAPRLAEVSNSLLKEEKSKLPDDEKLSQGFEDVDSNFRKHVETHRDQESGSTVVGAVVRKAEDGTYSIKILNCGDSRGLVIRGPSEEESDKAQTTCRRPDYIEEPMPSWPLVIESIDHKPDAPIEQNRIEAAGGFVSADDPPRLDANLAVSRGMGDFEYKAARNKPAGEQKVSCIPDVYEVHGLKEGSICVLACDGLWDVMTNEQVAQIVRDQLVQNPKSDLGVMSAMLVRKALQENSRDNVTCMIIQLVDGSEWSRKSNRFNDSDEMMFFHKLQEGQNVEDDVKSVYTKFLQRCDFPGLPVQCAESGRWYRSMWKCPGTGNVYINKHYQKKGWAKQKGTKANKAALATEEESW